MRSLDRGTGKAEFKLPCDYGLIESNSAEMITLGLSANNPKGIWGDLRMSRVSTPATLSLAVMTTDYVPTPLERLNTIRLLPDAEVLELVPQERLPMEYLEQLNNRDRNTAYRGIDLSRILFRVWVFNWLHRRIEAKDALISVLSRFRTTLTLPVTKSNTLHSHFIGFLDHNAEALQLASDLWTLLHASRALNFSC